MVLARIVQYQLASAWHPGPTSLSIGPASFGFLVVMVGSFVTCPGVGAYMTVEFHSKINGFAIQRMYLNILKKKWDSFIAFTQRQKCMGRGARYRPDL